jgi:ferredoxin
MRLQVNPGDCGAHRLCAELSPGWVQLDDWGYPIVGNGECPPALVDQDRRAGEARPTLALPLESDRR